MGDKSLLDKNKCWTQSYYQNWPGGKRDTDWVSNIVPLKYAELYKVIMNCSTLLRRLLCFHKEMRGGGVTEACAQFLSVVPYFPVCVQHSVLMLDRKHQWFPSEPLKERCLCLAAIMPVHNHDHHCQERENTCRCSLLCVTLASVSVVKIAFKLDFHYVNASIWGQTLLRLQGPDREPGSEISYCYCWDTHTFFQPLVITNQLFLTSVAAT